MSQSNTAEQAVDRAVADFPQTIRAQKIRAGLVMEEIDPLQQYVTMEECCEYAARIRSAIVPAPAVPDDVAETAKRLREATFTKGRMRGGVGGQTIEASMRSTFHEVSAWDLDVAADTIEAQAAELARLREENAIMAASLDEEERKHGLSTNGNMWRFWSQQLREYHDRRAKERAALTQPTGGSND